MDAGGVGNAHRDLGVTILREVARVEIDTGPRRIGLLDDLHRRLCRGGETSVIFNADQNAPASGIIGASLEYLDGPRNRLRFGRALRELSAKHANVRRAQ